MVHTNIPVQVGVPGVLAVSRMPREDEVDSIASTFRCVVALAEECELSYDLGDLARAGIRVLHKPVADLGAPNIIDLHEVVDFIAECRESTLVHCYGGRGRSGVVAVAYLMYSGGLGYGEALAKAREVDPGLVETEAQHRALRLYGRVLRATPPRLLSKAIEVGRSVCATEGREFGHGVGHASKVLELSAELTEGLEGTGLVRLSPDVERATYVAAVLHDVGVCRLAPGEPDDRHRERSYEVMVEHGEELDRACGCRVAERAALLARLHGGEDPVPEGADAETVLALGILRVADGLDYALDQSVERLRVELREGRVEVVVSCDERRASCRVDVRRANEKKRLLEAALGVPVAVVLEPGGSRGPRSWGGLVNRGRSLLG